jgi:hypothetical protein
MTARGYGEITTARSRRWRRTGTPRTTTAVPRQESVRFTARCTPPASSTRAERRAPLASEVVSTTQRPGAPIGSCSAR